MHTIIAPKREEIRLDEIMPGNTFIPSADEDVGYVYMVVSTRSMKLYVDFEEDNNIFAINLDDGELTVFSPDTSVYVVKGDFKGTY